MELDYNKEHWKKPCPKVNCHKKECGCCGLMYVNIPIALTEDVKPQNGLYSNAIVVYEETGEVYIYSAEGVPVKIKDGK